MLAEASLEEAQGPTVAALVRQLAASGLPSTQPRAIEQTHTTY